MTATPRRIDLLPPIAAARHTDTPGDADTAGRINAAGHTDLIRRSREGGNPTPPDAPIPAAGTVAIETHGCKLNQADSAVLARQFAQSGYRLVDANADADIIIVNSCTVTATADAKARQALRAARRANPDAVVIAAGCYPQRAAAELRNMPEVSLVVGNQEKPELPALAIAELTRRNGNSAPSSSPLTGEGRGEGIGIENANAGILRRSRAMLKIQEGCDQVCAYCIVPKVRGRERSIPPDDLITAVNRHVADGFKEVALTGTQLGTYGFDLDDVNLPRLLSRILNETDLPRLRVSSLQAHEIGPELLELWRNPRLCPHFHVPLQSGCDSTLRAMRRRYDAATYRRAVALIRDTVPDAAVTTDVIVGFPGEDAAAHDASLALAAAMGFADMHVFPYSQRPGTTAHYLPGQVDAAEKRRRAAAMSAVAAQGFTDYRNRMAGQTRPVLWETARFIAADNSQSSNPRRSRESGNPGATGNHGATLCWSGLTDNYVRATAETGLDLNLANRITPARLLRLDGKAMLSAPEI